MKNFSDPTISTTFCQPPCCIKTLLLSSRQQKHHPGHPALDAGSILSPMEVPGQARDDYGNL